MASKPYTPGFRYDIHDFLRDHAVAERQAPIAAFDTGNHPVTNSRAKNPLER